MKRWTKSEYDTCINLLKKYKNTKKVSKILNRSVGSIKQKINRNNLTLTELTSKKEKIKCSNCSEEFIGKPYRKFCSNSCSASYNNKKRNINYVLSDSGKESIIKSNEKYSIKCKEQYEKNENKCKVCQSKLPYEKRYRNTCSNKCLKIIESQSGRKSAQIQSENRRSKNEKLFARKCKEYFNKVLTNELIFNGWDADIIIEDIKYAILWNGKWHYEKIAEQHSVKQVQNRDKIKIKEIKKKGYTPYVIKDIGKFNKEKVNKEFIKLLKSCEPESRTLS